MESAQMPVACIPFFPQNQKVKDGNAKCIQKTCDGNTDTFFLGTLKKYFQLCPGPTSWPSHPGLQY
eukprot:5644153-Ditylum_brightwellii.AAC.1